MRKSILGYWVVTAVFCAFMLAGAIGNLMRAAPQKESMEGLGYPLYLMTFLGIAKILGVLAVLAPEFPKLKEWAYAGFTFLLLGASYSHAAAGDPVLTIVIPLVALGFGLLSYRLRPRTRRILETQLSGAWTD